MDDISNYAAGKANVRLFTLRKGKQMYFLGEPLKLNLTFLKVKTQYDLFNPLYKRGKAGSLPLSEE